MHNNYITMSSAYTIGSLYRILYHFRAINSTKKCPIPGKSIILFIDLTNNWKIRIIQCFLGGAHWLNVSIHVLIPWSSLTPNSKPCGKSVRDCMCDDTACTPCSVQSILPVRLLLLLRYHKNIKLKLTTSEIKKIWWWYREVWKTFFKWAENIWGNREKNKNIILLFNSLKTIPPTFVEWELAEHDWTISIFNIFSVGIDFWYSTTKTIFKYKTVIIWSVMYSWF